MVTVTVSCLATRASKHVAMSSDRVDASEKTEVPRVVVRDATREDLPAIREMIQELAAYEDLAEGPELTVNDLVVDGFECSTPWFFSLVAEWRGELVGHAMCNRAYSSWTGRALYVEDLYVVPELRHMGIGNAIFAELCQRALRWRVTRIDWHVLANNGPARRFYARLGATDLCVSEHRTALRLHEDRIKAVADGDLIPDAQMPKVWP